MDGFSSKTDNTEMENDSDGGFQDAARDLKTQKTRRQSSEICMT